MRRMGHWGLVTASIIFCIVLVEVLVRLLLPRPGFQPFPPQQIQGLLVPHPARAYAYAPNFVAEIPGENGPTNGE